METGRLCGGSRRASAGMFSCGGPALVFAGRVTRDSCLGGAETTGTLRTMHAVGHGSAPNAQILAAHMCA